MASGLCIVSEPVLNAVYMPPTNSVKPMVPPIIFLLCLLVKLPIRLVRDCVP